MRKLLSILFFIPFLSYGTIATDDYYKIKHFRIWNDFGGNVLIINLLNQNEQANSHCPGGYWVDKTSTTGAHLLQVALSAYNNQTPIRIYAYEDQDWPSLSTKECKIALIELKPITQ